MERMSQDDAAKLYLFGPFRLEVLERRLLRDGELVPLLGKAFDTLVLLVEAAGTLQKQQVLIDRLWPEVVVEPNNLQQNISIVRRALGGVPGIEIETIRGQGYRLHATVREASVPARGSSAQATAAASAELGRAPDAASQRIQFCSARDGSRLAYARLGSGPALVKAANWLNHLELDLESPIWTHWLARLSRDHCLVRYDARGNGLSDWKPRAIRFADFVSDLGVVFDAAGVQRAPLLGISQGAAVAVAYAAQNPERVSALILVGGCARGWRVKQNARLTERMEALMVLMRQGWGAEHAAFRQIFTSSFFPTGTREQMDWFNDLQRRTTSPDNAAAMLSALGDLDVREQLPRIRVPALVVHARGDTIVPMNDGLELAAGIAGARFVPLDSDNHLLLEGEAAWHRFGRELDDFLREVEG
jgi:pimeloyl-ACP methyl ester carboxylesterase/DNA-binding winged helix-turn-helix (wHTH) protein